VAGASKDIQILFIIRNKCIHVFITRNYSWTRTQGAQPKLFQTAKSKLHSLFPRHYISSWDMVFHLRL